MGGKLGSRKRKQPYPGEDTAKFKGWRLNTLACWGAEGRGEREAILNEDKASKKNVKQNLAKLGNYINITQYANRGYSICIFTLPLYVGFFFSMQTRSDLSHSNKNKPPPEI